MVKQDVVYVRGPQPPGHWAHTNPQPVRKQAAQQEVSGRLT